MLGSEAFREAGTKEASAGAGIVALTLQIAVFTVVLYSPALSL